MNYDRFQNWLSARTAEFACGVDDQGQAEWPDSLEEYVTLLEEKGFAVTRGTMEEKYSNGIGWYAANGAYTVTAFPKAFLLFIAGELKEYASI